MAPVLRWIHTIVMLHLLKLLTSEELSTFETLDIKQMLSTDLLECVFPQQTGAYLSLLAQLLWEKRGPKNFERIRTVFAKVLLKTNAILKEGQKVTRERLDRELINVSSYSRYISSCFGRRMEPRRQAAIDVAVFIPLHYVWAISHYVTEAVSKPEMLWMFSGDREARLLGSAERQSFLNLMRDFNKSYQKISQACGRANTWISANERSVNPLKERDVQFTQITSYLQLEDWAKLQTALLNFLYCRSIVELWVKSRPFSRESRQVNSLLHLKSRDIDSRSWDIADPCVKTWFSFGLRAVKLKVELANRNMEVPPDHGKAGNAQPIDVSSVNPSVLMDGIRGVLYAATSHRWSRYKEPGGFGAMGTHCCKGIGKTTSTEQHRAPGAACSRSTNKLRPKLERSRDGHPQRRPSVRRTRREQPGNRNGTEAS